jgi:predicted RNA methylase
MKSLFDSKVWQINQPIVLSKIYTELDRVDGVQSVTSVKISNLYNTNDGYSGNVYDIAAATKAPVITMEGAPTIAAKAKDNFKKLGFDHIEVVEGDFEHTLPLVVAKLEKVGLAYVDGNHRYEPTIQYFHELLKHASDDTVIIFDDIHWSAAMEKAWDEIKCHPSVTLSIDLFFIGLVFFRKENKEPSHFVIRY